MTIPKKDLRFEYIRGTGPGGQHRNKTASACRITHIPTGITAYADTRSQLSSKKMAMKDLESKLREAKASQRAAAKKSRRDRVIKERDIIRTYNYDRGTVKDHRSKKSASIKEVLEKGRIDLLK